jgi:hypothetical protein
LDYSDLQFILAGPGHSGSTWLGHVLRKTPHIYVTPEINYLTWTKSEHSLDEFFTEANGAEILGEHSNNYFSWDGIPEQLQQLNRDLKIIIMVRDPVEKLVSFYLHDIRWGILPHYVPLEIAVLPNYFERRYIHDSDYALNVARWLAFFPASSLYLFRSPADTKSGDQVPDLVEFLGGDRASAPKLGPMNKAVLPYFPQMHRHATFGKPGIAKTLSRAMDPINIAAGSFKKHPVTEKGMKVVREALGERASLDKLRAVARREGIRGAEWL